MRVSFLICLFVGFSVLPFPTASWAQAARNMRNVSQRLDKLTETVGMIEKKAQEIISKQNETIEQIKNLKIVSRQ